MSGVGHCVSGQMPLSFTGRIHPVGFNGLGETPDGKCAAVRFNYAVMNEHHHTPAGELAGEFFQSEANLRQHILVVEEADDLRQLNAEVLMDAAYQVEVAEDGAAAWAALQLNHYDLLITDQFLPKVSGVELLKKLHTARMTLPVIMATEILPTWEFALHPCLQAVIMLRKPYTIEKLLGIVKSVLPETAGVGAAIVSASNWQRQPSADRLRL
jgi:CheY-like chemotaxis protein